MEDQMTKTSVHSVDHVKGTHAAVRILEDPLVNKNHMDASTSGGNMDTHSQVPYYEVELSMEEDAMDDSNGMEENGSVAQELPQ
ncbi:hypothetical protein V6N13_059331 [Hibiscus sabdariffa]